MTTILPLRATAVAIAAILATACAALPATGDTRAASTQAPADAFLAALSTHCGQAFAGRIVANAPKPTTADPFEGKALVMHVRGCDDPARGLRVPFHVGDDHSAPGC